MLQPVPILVPHLEKLPDFRVPFIVLCVAVAQTIRAQPASTIEWQRCYGGSAHEWPGSIASTPDSGLVMCGWSTSTDGDVSGENHGEGDVWWVKLDSQLEMQYQRLIGGSDNETSTAVIPVADGGYVITGETWSPDGDVTGHHAFVDLLAVYLNSDGDLRWCKALGGSDWDHGFDVVEMENGDLLFCGDTRSDNGDVSGNHGERDGWWVRMDTAGNVVQQACVGGSEDDAFVSVCRTADGGYAFVGRCWSDTGDFAANHGHYDMWVMRTDSDLQPQWHSLRGGTGWDEPFSIEATNDGGFLITGATLSSNGDVSGYHAGWDAWVAKLDGNGALEWQKAMGGSLEDRFVSAVEVPEGGFLVSGFTKSTDGDVTGKHGNSDAWLVYFDGLGNVVWNWCAGGTGADEGETVLEHADGSYYRLASTTSQEGDGDVAGNHGLMDLWLTRLGNSTTGSNDPAPIGFSIIADRTAGIVRLIADARWAGAELTLSDMTGRTLRKERLNGVDQMIPGLDLPNGTYQLTLLRAGERGSLRLVWQ